MTIFDYFPDWTSALYSSSIDIFDLNHNQIQGM